MKINSARVPTYYTQATRQSRKAIRDQNAHSADSPNHLFLPVSSTQIVCPKGLLKAENLTCFFSSESSRLLSVPQKGYLLVWPKHEWCLEKDDTRLWRWPAFSLQILMLTCILSSDSACLLSVPRIGLDRFLVQRLPRHQANVRHVSAEASQEYLHRCAVQKAGEPNHWWHQQVEQVCPFAKIITTCRQPRNLYLGICTQASKVYIHATILPVMRTPDRQWFHQKGVLNTASSQWVERQIIAYYIR